MKDVDGLTILVSSLKALCTTNTAPVTGVDRSVDR